MVLAAGPGLSALAVSVATGAASRLPPLLKNVKPAKPTTATIAATIAAVQLGRRGSGRIRSASKSGAATVGVGRPPWPAT